MIEYVLPIEEHGVDPETGFIMYTGHRVQFPLGTCKRRIRRELRKLLEAYGVRNYREVFRSMRFKELL